ncbi:MAG: peptidoglycan DD-metalloendopeptidase family protein [Pseudomonadales bacterium]
MKKQMVITLTTGAGSHQFSMSKVARYIAAIIFLAVIAFVLLSNWMLVRTTDELNTLSEDHQKLNGEYKSVLGTQQKYERELGELSDLFDRVVNQRDKLALENGKIGLLSDALNSLTDERDQLRQDITNIPKLQSSLTKVELERDRLQAENIKIEQINASLDGNLNALDKSLDELEKMLNVQPLLSSGESRFERLAILTKQRLFILNAIPNGMPISALRISDKFGMRFHPIQKVKKMHEGMDFKATIGTPVYAPADGVVSVAQRRSARGNFVKLSHNFGFETSYSHLNKMLVKRGEFVHKGQKIAESGNTGRSTGPHLHYELLHLSKPIDPQNFISWNIANFDTIFEKVESVKWASLKNLYPLNQSEMR